MRLLGIFVIFATAMLISFALTAVLRHYALKRNLIDRPNMRSLHEFPVPRGGGAAILVATSVCLIGLLVGQNLNPFIVIPWLGCGFCVGALGWADDHRELSPLVRLSVQFLLALIFCTSVVSAPDSLIADWQVWHWLVTAPVAALAIAWMINLYNFMDGADGYAVSQAFLVAGSGAVISGIFGAADLMMLAISVAGAAAGFLVWNWQPARIFMGDVGSYFLGFQFAALIIYSFDTGHGAWMWLILLVPFIVDASLTLGLRVIQRKRWWQAHRSHLYQLLILDGRSHANVSAGLACVTLVVLIPVAAMAVARPMIAPFATATVYVFAAIIWMLTRIKITRRQHSTT